MPISSNPSGAATPATIAGFRLVRALGRGGLGQVFEATDPAGSRVALKVFDLGVDDTGDIASAFERESSVALRLDHPGIVKVFSAGRDRGVGFIAMEFIAGTDLTPHMRSGNLLAVPVVLGIAERIARALEHAHQLGIVHRDIKPANILIDREADIVKVADFSLARFGDAFRSRTGIIAGTPHYMSPEQLSAGAIDARADLYALGVLLFEALSGRLPHDAGSLGSLLRKVATEPAPALQSLRPELPAEIGQLVARLLATRARDRPPDAGAVARELSAIAARL